MLCHLFFFKLFEYICSEIICLIQYSFKNMSAWIIWLIVAAALLVIEVFSQSIWALSLSVGCIAASVLSVYVESAALQGICVAIVALVAWLSLAPLIKYMKARTSHKARTGMDALLGRRAIVTEEIRPDKLGRARIDGDYWQVSAPGTDHVINHGSQVVVTSYDSIILIVEEIK